LSLAKLIEVSPLHQRAARVDQDISTYTLQGLIGTKTALRTFRDMATRYPKDCAFIWTGSYGTGKSSMAIQFASLLSQDENLRKQAALPFDKRQLRPVSEKFVGKDKLVEGWKLLTVQGDRASPAAELRRAFKETFPNVQAPPRGNAALINALQRCARRKGRRGLLIIIDEMGKFLETSESREVDVYFFQQLAEACNRSEGRMLLLGLLHSSLGMYSTILDEQSQDEWSKVNGRFSEFPITVSISEQVNIIAQSINHAGYKPPLKAIRKVANTICSDLGVEAELVGKFVECSPLHPASVCLLTKLAQTSFAQNQRSVFTFLNSSEPLGFRDFLLRTKNPSALLRPEHLWDYLKANLEGAISMSGEGHKWALVEDCVERAMSLDLSGACARVMKTIGIMYLLGGIRASRSMLRHCFWDDLSVDDALRTLQKRSIIIERFHLDAYHPFEGTDFDIEHAYEEAVAAGAKVAGSRVAAVAGLGAVQARGHCIRTGTVRYLEITFACQGSTPQDIRCELSDIRNRYLPASHCATLLVDLRDERSKGEIENRDDHDQFIKIIHFCPKDPARLNALITDMSAYEEVNRRPELQGDKVARNEIARRLEFTKSRIRAEVARLFRNNSIVGAEDVRDILELGSLASKQADDIFNKSPMIRNELLNRAKPTAAVIGALRKLFLAMLECGDQEDLDLVGYPAEKGLYLSLIKSGGIHKKIKNCWCFCRPRRNADPLYIADAWSAGLQLLRSKKQKISLQQLFCLWGKPPFGMHRGSALLLVWAMIMSHRDEISIYQGGLYRAVLDGTDIDCLLMNNSDIELFWMELDAEASDLLAFLVKAIDWGSTPPSSNSPLEISRSLVKRILSLPEWTQKTNTLSPPTKQLRDRLKRANDPNQVIFADLPDIYGGASQSGSAGHVARQLAASVKELDEAYPKMLQALETAILKAIDSNGDATALAKRSCRLAGKTGNYRLDAFAQRLECYKPGDEDTIMAIGSLAANKPVDVWVDRDLASALIEIAYLGSEFAKAEIHFRSMGENNGSVSFGLVTSSEGQTQIDMESFTVSSDRLNVLSERAQGIIEGQLKDLEGNREELLAVVALLGRKVSRNDGEQ